MRSLSLFNLFNKLNMQFSDIIYYPLSKYIEEINHAKSIIPHNRYMTKDEILSLSEKDKISLQVYFGYTTPNFFTNNNYECLKCLTEMAGMIIQKLPADSIVIVPGDSASKIVRLIDLLYNTDPSKISCNDNIDCHTRNSKLYDNYEYEEKIVKRGVTKITKIIKPLKFVKFPISGLSTYLKEVHNKEFYQYILVRNENNTKFPKRIFQQQIQRLLNNNTFNSRTICIFSYRNKNNHNRIRRTHNKLFLHANMSALYRTKTNYS